MQVLWTQCAHGLETNGIAEGMRDLSAHRSSLKIAQAGGRRSRDRRVQRVSLATRGPPLDSRNSFLEPQLHRITLLASVFYPVYFSNELASFHPHGHRMSLSWHKRKTRLSSLIAAEDGEDGEAVAMDQLMHGQTVIGKTGK